MSTKRLYSLLKLNLRADLGRGGGGTTDCVPDSRPPWLCSGMTWWPAARRSVAGPGTALTAFCSCVLTPSFFHIWLTANWSRLEKLSSIRVFHISSASVRPRDSLLDKQSRILPTDRTARSSKDKNNSSSLFSHVPQPSVRAEESRVQKPAFL